MDGAIPIIAIIITLCFLCGSLAYAWRMVSIDRKRNKKRENWQRTHPTQHTEEAGFGKKASGPKDPADI